MKKIGMLLLAMALLLAPFNVLPVHADDPSSDFYFIDNADGISVTITGYADSAPRDYVNIPGKINGKQVTAIGNEAFQNKSIQSLELPDGLVSIGRKAFYNNFLTSLEIPASVKNIDQGAFQLNKLTSLTLNDGLEEIGKNAFTNNELTELSLPDSLTELGEYAFQQNKIVDLSLSNNLEEIGQYTFAFNKLTALDLPASVRIIGNSAFTANRILTLVIPETVATVKKDAFRYNALELVTFLGTPILEDDMDDHSSGFFYQHSDEADSLLYNWYTDPEYTEAWNKTVAATPASPLTIYAAWQKNNVTFNANGGSGHVTKKVNFGEKTTAVSSNKTEHTLEGWYKEEELINKWDFNTDVVTRTITLYAKWTANTYTVSFNLNGGTGTVPDQTIEYNGQAVAPANPSKAGHTFEGWYTNTSFTTLWNFDTDQVKRDMTLYAKWTASKYNISFQSNGGTAVAAQTVSHGEKVVSPATPSRTGYTLEGWYTDSDLKTAWNFATGVVEENMILHAKWTVNTYTVSFQSNGGTAVADQSIAYENKVSLPADPIKANHTFAGWYTTPGLTWVWDFDLNIVRNDMTLYAKWTVNEYTVSFQSNGGTAVAAQTIAEDGKVVSLTPPSKAGHAFAGWYADEELKTLWNFETAVVKENMTLYAKWTVNTYTVSFQSNGGTAVAAQTIAEDGKITLPTPPSKAGHAFAGWYTDAELKTTWNFATDEVKENMTLYANWTLNTYTVTFQSNGGTAVAAQTVAHDAKVVSPASPKKSGYTFAGWFKDEGLTLAWNFATDVVTTDMTLYAKWSKIAYVPAPEPTVEPEPTIEPDPEIIPEEEPEQPVCATDFSDISHHWAEDAIRDIASRCIIIGYPDGEFKPNAPLIRAHVAVMFARAFELSPNRSVTPFNDVSSDSPYYEAIMKASQAGIFEGVNGSFYPEQHLTRAEMAKLLVTAFNLPLGGKSTFLDVPEAHWASSYIAALEAYGLASGEDGYYNPDEPVTRAQFVAFMYRALYL